MSEYCTSLLLERIKYTRAKFLKLQNVNKRLSGYGHGDETVTEADASINHEHRGNQVRRSYREQTNTNRSSVGHYAKSNSYSYRSSRSPSGINDSGNQEAADASSASVISLAEEQKRYLQILNEIFEIAQIFPNVLG